MNRQTGTPTGPWRTQVFDAGCLLGCDVGQRRRTDGTGPRPM